MNCSTKELIPVSLAPTESKSTVVSTITITLYCTGTTAFSRSMDYYNNLRRAEHGWTSGKNRQDFFKTLMRLTTHPYFPPGCCTVPSDAQFVPLGMHAMRFAIALPMHALCTYRGMDSEVFYGLTLCESRLPQRPMRSLVHFLSVIPPSPETLQAYAAAMGMTEMHAANSNRRFYSNADIEISASLPSCVFTLGQPFAVAFTVHNKASFSINAVDVSLVNCSGFDRRAIGARDDVYLPPFNFTDARLGMVAWTKRHNVLATPIAPGQTFEFPPSLITFEVCRCAAAL
jgi:hypothetical protein